MLKSARLRMAAVPPVRGATFLNTQQPAVKVPNFASARKRKAETTQQQGPSTSASAFAPPPVIGTPTTLVSPPSAAIEEASWAAVNQQYGFRVKPQFYCWTQFLSELKRYDLGWRNGSVQYMAFVMTMLDYAPGSAEQLFSLRTDASKSHSISLTFQTAVSCYTSALRSFFISFVDEMSTRKELNCELFVPKVHGKYLTLENDYDAEKNEIKVASGSSATQSQSPNDCLIKAKVCDNNTVAALAAAKPVFHMSFQTYVSLIANALLVYLQQCDMGVPNYQLMDRQQVEWVEWHWSYLRQQACLHKQPWPIDVSSLPKR